jgi:hypothetical protein
MGVHATDELIAGAIAGFLDCLLVNRELDDLKVLAHRRASS